MSRNFRKTIAILVALVIFISSGEYVLASNNEIDVTTVKTTDEIVEELIVKNDFVESKRVLIQEDLEILKEVGIEISFIENVSMNENELVYLLPVKENLTDEITVKKDNGDVIMNVIEGEIHNELILKSDGAVLLDGKEVTYETEYISSASGNEETILPRTGGIQWYSLYEAPAYLVNSIYKSFSESWRCSSVNLQKSLSSIAYATFIGLVTSGLAGGVIGFTTTAFYELINYDPDSTCISYRDYVAQGRDDVRYFRGKRETYTAQNFTGRSTITYSYGVML